MGETAKGGVFIIFADAQILEALKLCSRCCKWIFCNFPVALWKIEEYNAVNKHIEGVFQVQHIGVGGFYERDDSAEQYDYQHYSDWCD